MCSLPWAVLQLENSTRQDRLDMSYLGTVRMNDYLKQMKARHTSCSFQSKTRSSKRMRASQSKYIRPGEPRNILWSDLRPRQNHLYLILLYNGMLALKVASQCLNEFDVGYQIVEIVEHEH